MSASKEAKGIYVTTSDLTSSAKIFAKKNDIEIWDKYNIAKHITSF
jgi:hypothetical protein